jgi:archaellum component FlaD/FlaE
MSDTNEEKQVEMELTEVEEKTIRNRFATKTQEEDQGTGLTEVQDVGEAEAEQLLEEQEAENDTEESVDGDSERDPVDTPSESEQDQTTDIKIQEDSFGREYIVYQGIPYYREETSWNTPFAVQLSFSLIMIINFLNIALAIGQMAAC